MAHHEHWAGSTRPAVLLTLILLGSSLAELASDTAQARAAWQPVELHQDYKGGVYFCVVVMPRVCGLQQSLILTVLGVKK